MPKCSAIAGSGQPCKGLVRAGSDYCPAHDPDRAEDRRRAASKAARSKPHGELHAVKSQLRQLADDVLAGNVDKGIASVAAQVLGVYIRACEQDRKIREQDELLERLAALEQATQTNGRRPPWGA